jgi:hypothetical protein
MQVGTGSIISRALTWPIDPIQKTVTPTAQSKCRKMGSCKILRHPYKID